MADWKAMVHQHHGDQIEYRTYSHGVTLAHDAGIASKPRVGIYKTSFGAIPAGGIVHTPYHEVKEENLDEATKYFTDAAEWHKHAQVHGHVVFKTGGPTKTQGPTLGAHSKTGEHRGTFVYDKKGHGGKGWQFTPYHEVKEETISENDTKCNAFGHRPFKGTCLDCGAPVSQSTRPGYSAVAVDKAIKSSRKKISGREAKLIHRLLRGRH
jgi:hypothetical protein